MTNSNRFLAGVLFTTVLSLVSRVPAQDVVKVCRRLTTSYSTMSMFEFSMFGLNPERR